MKPRLFKLRHRGCDVTLLVGRHSLAAEARAGFSAPVKDSMPHGGLIGPSTPWANQHHLAKHLIGCVVDKTLGLTRRSAFDALVDDLHRNLQRQARPMRKALLLMKPNRNRTRTVLIFPRGSTLRAS